MFLKLMKFQLINTTQRAISPCPPPFPRTDPHPQYRRYCTPSDIDLTSIEGDPVGQRQTGVEYYWRGQEEFIPIILLSNHALKWKKW